MPVDEIRGFEGFGKEVSEIEDRLESTGLIFKGNISGKKNILIKDSSIGFDCEASGKISLTLEGSNRIRRIIRVPPGKSLKLTYLSRDSSSTVEDTIYVGEGASLEYDGRFRADERFANVVKVIHEEPGGRSEVNVHGLVFGEARVITTGDVRPGARGAETSVNSLVVVFGDGKVTSLPELLISEPDSKAYHSFKKVVLDPEQVFYLRSRGIGEKDIERLYEKFILG